MAALKPPASARRIPLYRALPRRALTDAGVEALFRAAEVMTEGELSADGDDGAEAFFGSVLVSVELPALRAACRGLEAPDDPERLRQIAEGSVRVRVRVHRLARAAVRERYPTRALGTVQVETRFRVEADRLLVDVDVEAPFERLGSAGRAAP